MKALLVLFTIVLAAKCGSAPAAQVSAPRTSAIVRAAVGGADSVKPNSEVRIPMSLRKASGAIQLVEAGFDDAERLKFALVSVEWRAADRFEATELNPNGALPESESEWSWFLTYKSTGDVAVTSGQTRIFRVSESGEVSSPDFNRPSSGKPKVEGENESTNPRTNSFKGQPEEKYSIEEWIHLLTEANDGTGATDQKSGLQSQVDAGERIDDSVQTKILRIRRDMLRLIIADIGHAGNPENRKKFLEEFLQKSGGFLKEFPQQKSVWLLRAIVALELERAPEGWDAGRKVWEFFKDQIDDSRIRAIFAKLERKGWLREKTFEMADRGGGSWTNSLGMVFVPVEGTGVLFGIWETRVMDYKAFEQAVGHDTGDQMYVVKGDQLVELAGYSWKNPGFAQSQNDPVVGVNGEDAVAFCEWLTGEERKAGRLESGQRYRLPSDEEWRRAAGGSVYPWGQQWPPPAGAGNYAGDEARDGNWPLNSSTIEGYRDAFPKTSPVGSFATNQYGLFDVGGNVWEWCDNLYSVNPRQRAQRGASWFNHAGEKLMSSFRAADLSSRRSAWVGFRCVLDFGPSSK
ncbi:MAG: SUMF1/EgtB/PvdO family nonheme iron enzyme [Verrucomicrobia bacterium]|nr:SUMF1/EgtB/PvdO family nonheme iron enzyme [Verrucomicrobiota bacterium]